MVGTKPAILEPLSSGACRYAVFISYRHADNVDTGRRWATWLHEELESYEIPSDLAGRTNLRGQATPASLYPVFRDEEELPADADLSASVRKALEDSNLLVVICSPRAVQSHFVADEIRYFKEIGRSDRVLALIIDGEPNAASDPDKAKRFGAEAECLPEPLRYGVVNRDGQLDWSARSEPIAADCRPGGRPLQGWTTAAAYGAQIANQPGMTRTRRAVEVREYAERLQLAKLKVIAGALGQPLGDITQRDRARELRQARRRIRLLLFLGISFALLGGAAGVFAWKASYLSQDADTQRDRAVTTLADSDLLEGIGRMGAPDTAREGLAFLARSARAGHESAAVRIWAFLQQRSVWLPVDALPGPMPERTPRQMRPVKPSPASAEASPYPESLVPDRSTWHAESHDGKRCLTFFGGGDCAQSFRVWEASGAPLTPWLGVKEEEDYTHMRGAALSESGRFAAIVAARRRAPDYVVIWDVEDAVWVGDAIEAKGGHPNYQGGSFEDVWFMESGADAGSAALVTLSSRGDASIHSIAFGRSRTDVTHNHGHPVTVAVADGEHGLFVSASAGGSIRVSRIGGDADWWPLPTTAPVEGLRVDSADRITARLAGGRVASWLLTPPLGTPPAPQRRLKLIDAAGLHWDFSKKSGAGSADVLPVVADRRGARRLEIVEGRTVRAANTARSAGGDTWSRTFPVGVAHARFLGEDQVVVQSLLLTTEIWDSARDVRLHPVIDESTSFTAGTATDKALLSSISPDGRFALTRSYLWDPPNANLYAFTVWDTATGKRLSERMFLPCDGMENQPDHTEFSADGSYLLFGDSTGEDPQGVTDSLQLRPPRDIARQLPDIAEAIAGVRVAHDGTLEPVARAPEPALRALHAAVMTGR